MLEMEVFWFRAIKSMDCAKASEYLMSYLGVQSNVLSDLSLDLNKEIKELWQML